MSLACLRSFFFPASLAALAVLAASYALEHLSGLLPCALCSSQRLMLGLYALVCLLALLRPSGGRRRVHAWLALGCAAGGALLAGRHVWLQGEPAPAGGCPALAEPPGQQPWLERLHGFLLGEPDCQSISWSFLDLTLPEWSLLAFVLLAVPPLSALLTYRLRRLAAA